jgi:hypothetical protein
MDFCKSKRSFIPTSIPSIAFLMGWLELIVLFMTLVSLSFAHDEGQLAQRVK